MNQVPFCQIIPGKNNLKLHTPQVLRVLHRGEQEIWVTGDAVQVYMERETSGYRTGQDLTLDSFRFL